MLYERFSDEAEFRDKLVKPLLNRLGFYGVSEQHGSQEFGKDFVFSELHRLGGMRHYAAQVKHEEKIHQGRAVDDLLSQVRQAFEKPFTRTDSPRDCHVSAVYVFNSGEITANAKEQLLSGLMRERYGDNVHFLDGERLDGLNQWATLQNDTNARTRLLGLRSALRFMIAVLKNSYIQKLRPDVRPLFINGIELYLSEPVNCEDQTLVLLFKLWGMLQAIDGIRQILMRQPGNSENFEKMSPTIIRAAKEAHLLAIEICQIVDGVIEKLKPLE